MVRKWPFRFYIFSKKGQKYNLSRVAIFVLSTGTGPLWSLKHKRIFKTCALPHLFNLNCTLNIKIWQKNSLNRRIWNGKSYSSYMGINSGSQKIFPSEKIKVYHGICQLAPSGNFKENSCAIYSHGQNFTVDWHYLCNYLRLHVSLSFSLSMGHIVEF